jgi:hypothetical protein
MRRAFCREVWQHDWNLSGGGLRATAGTASAAQDIFEISLSFDQPPRSKHVAAIERICLPRVV